MTPYYQRDGITLYHADCLEFLPTLAEKYVDSALCKDKIAIVTDPPWGVANNNANASRGRGHRPYDKLQTARDFPPVVGDDQGFDPSPMLRFETLILWGANHYSAKLPSSSFWLCWDRKAGKAADSDITDCELAWTRGIPYRTVRMFRHMWAGFQRDSQAGEKHLHPMEKPVALMQWCISFTKGRIILDPYMGVGTTGVACVKLGRNFLGVEIEEKYCEIAANRISKVQDQGTLDMEV